MDPARRHEFVAAVFAASRLSVVAAVTAAVVAPMVLESEPGSPVDCWRSPAIRTRAGEAELLHATRTEIVARGAEGDDEEKSTDADAERALADVPPDLPIGELLLEPGNFVVEGVVVAAEDGSPVAGAIVEVEQHVYFY